VTAAKLGEASCNGKSRLFIALARRAGIPSRLVGGVILSTGVKRTSHQWVEAYVSGH
jgi:transglutaminase-like putative cysteine protease